MNTKELSDLTGCSEAELNKVLAPHPPRKRGLPYKLAKLTGCPDLEGTLIGSGWTDRKGVWAAVQRGDLQPEYVPMSMAQFKILLKFLKIKRPTPLRLKPCPFCGSKNFRVHAPYQDFGISWVDCGECSGQGPAVEASDCQTDDNVKPISNYQIEYAARKAWNRRAK